MVHANGVFNEVRSPSLSANVEDDDQQATRRFYPSYESEWQAVKCNARRHRVTVRLPRDTCRQSILIILLCIVPPCSQCHSMGSVDSPI